MPATFRLKRTGPAAKSLSPARTAALWQALIPVATLVVLIAGNLLLFKGDAAERSGDPHLPLIAAAAVAAGMGRWLGHGWRDMEKGIVNGIAIGLNAILILMVIGMLIGTWIASGIVPTLIYHGLGLLNPKIFLVASCLICSLVSVATGSSWTTAGTVGIALIGIGAGLSIPAPMVAGSIVSGAYFGDKISPLSDSTNLAPAVAGSELFEHIHHLTYTTVPALIISLFLYGVLGFFVVDGRGDDAVIRVIQTGLQEGFHLSPLLLLPPLLVIVMVIYRLPALPALLAGAALGAVLAWLIQESGLKDILHVAQYGFESATGVEAVDTLLSRGGLDSMMFTVSLILCALTFGGVMERTGMLGVIAASILRLATSTGRLILATVLTCIGMNVIAPDQYLSLIVPGRMYRDAYAARGLHPKNLSRTLEDSGTLSSALIPWNTCGAYMWMTLGVFPFAYLPFAFLNLISPVIAVVYGFTGWTIEPKTRRASERSR